jgi:hypothetical protein
VCEEKGGCGGDRETNQGLGWSACSDRGRLYHARSSTAKESRCHTALPWFDPQVSLSLRALPSYAIEGQEALRLYFASADLLVMVMARLRELPSEEEDRRHRDLSRRVDRGVLRARGQIEALQKSLGVDLPSQSTPERPQTPRTPWTTTTDGGNTPNRGGSTRRRTQMRLLSASGRKARSMGMATPDASPIGNGFKRDGPLGGRVVNSSPAFVTSSPARSLMSASETGKASRVFAASACGPSQPAANNVEAITEAMREETRAALSSVQEELEEQRAATRRLGLEAHRLQ